jgi:predicted glutamine amidotransferase
MIVSYLFSVTESFMSNSTTQYCPSLTGLCFYDGRGLRAFHDSEPAAESSLAEFLQIHPVKTYNMVSHIRYATRGEVKLENVHPFQREVSPRSKY